MKNGFSFLLRIRNVSDYASSFDKLWMSGLFSFIVPASDIGVRQNIRIESKKKKLAIAAIHYIKACFVKDAKPLIQRSPGVACGEEGTLRLCSGLKACSVKADKPLIQSLSKDEARWNKTLVLFLSFFFLQSSLLALSVGSNTVPSRQTLITFPNTDTNNTMLGFAVFEAGFTLQDATTTCTYNDFYPVSGTVTFNGGQLLLNEDLCFGNNCSVVNGGRLYGNNYSFVFQKSLLDLHVPTVYPPTPSPAASRFLFSDTTLAFNSTTRFHIPFHFRGACRIDGRGNFLYMDDAADIIVRPGSSLVIENAFIRGIKGSKLRCLTDSGVITLRNSTLTFARDYTFTRGSLLFDGDVAITGTSAFTYGAALTSTISQKTTLLFDQGTSFNYAPRRARGDLIYMPDVSSVLYLKGCSLTSTSTGMVLSTGTLVLDDTITLSSQGANSGEAITISSGLNVEVLGSGSLLCYGRIKYV